MEVAATPRTFTSATKLREAASGLVGTTIEFKGGFVGNSHAGVIGDVVAFSGSQGPVLANEIPVLGPVAGVELLYGALQSNPLGHATGYSGHEGTIRGVIELLGAKPVLTAATIVAP